MVQVHGVLAKSPDYSLSPLLPLSPAWFLQVSHCHHQVATFPHFTGIVDGFCLTQRAPAFPALLLEEVDTALARAPLEVRVYPAPSPRVQRCPGAQACEKETLFTEQGSSCKVLVHERTSCS